MAAVLQAYGLNPHYFEIKPFGSGLINHTWKVTGSADYILQKVNTDVFKQPELIANNLNLLDQHLKDRAPEYLFTAPIAAQNGDGLVKLNGSFYRLFNFVKNSHTVDFLTKSEQAYEAARQFSRFTYLLRDFEVSKLKYTLPGFHDLSARLKAFNLALANATDERIKQAKVEIEQVKQLAGIETTYSVIVKNAGIPLRVVHHDTKINNVLFDDDDKGLCVIDLDTVMPGYYISDVGDMMRTYLAEANEEEQDLDKIKIRENFFIAIYRGYYEQMGSILTKAEKELFTFSGKFMIYMQAVRFLTDYLNGDIYYTIKYPGHNLLRTKNQLRLLELYLVHEVRFKEIIASFQKP